MKEKPFEFRKIKKKEEPPVAYPPAWCSGICKNAMSEMCVEHCAIERDTSYFEPKPGLTLDQMPRFPETSGMSREEKFKAVTVYLSAIVDELKGVVSNEPPENPVRIRRPNLNGSRRIEILENLQKQDIFVSEEKSDSARSD